MKRVRLIILSGVVLIWLALLLRRPETPENDVPPTPEMQATPVAVHRAAVRAQSGVSDWEVHTPMLALVSDPALVTEPRAWVLQRLVDAGFEPEVTRAGNPRTGLRDEYTVDAHESGLRDLKLVYSLFPGSARTQLDRLQYRLPAGTFASVVPALDGMVSQVEAVQEKPGIHAWLLANGYILWVRDGEDGVSVTLEIRQE